MIRTSLLSAMACMAFALLACGEAEDDNSDPTTMTTPTSAEEISTVQLPAKVAPYPLKARGAFLDFCKGESPPKQCQCALTYLEKNVPLSELVAASTRAKEEDLPQPLAAAVDACASRAE